MPREYVMDIRRERLIQKWLMLFLAFNHGTKYNCLPAGSIRAMVRFYDGVVHQFEGLNNPTAEKLTGMFEIGCGFQKGSLQGRMGTTVLERKPCLLVHTDHSRIGFRPSSYKAGNIKIFYRGGHARLHNFMADQFYEAIMSRSDDFPVPDIPALEEFRKLSREAAEEERKLDPTKFRIP